MGCQSEERRDLLARIIRKSAREFLDESEKAHHIVIMIRAIDSLCIDRRLLFNRHILSGVHLLIFRSLNQLHFHNYRWLLGRGNTVFRGTRLSEHILHKRKLANITNPDSSVPTNGKS